MNREIKFRAYSKKHNEIWDCDHLALNRVSVSSTGKGCIGLDEDGALEILDWLIPMQYTGLKDKNGKEIYEGDVLKIEWQKYSTGGYIQMSDSYVEHSEIVKVEFFGLSSAFRKKDGKLMSIPKNSQIYVVGNIYENPELLK